MHVGECCNREVVIASRRDSVATAARLMRSNHVGNIVVVDRANGRNRPVGIVTDRDLVVEVLAQDAPAAELTVDDVMSEGPATAREDEDVLETLRRMRALGVRRMPVVDDKGALEGIIAIDDILGLVSESMNDVVGVIAREIKAEQKRRR
jgi:CBS domain-containing protein